MMSHCCGHVLFGFFSRSALSQIMSSTLVMLRNTKLADVLLCDIFLLHLGL